jgi:hypothetical protein
VRWLQARWAAAEVVLSARNQAAGTALRRWRDGSSPPISRQPCSAPPFRRGSFFGRTAAVSTRETYSRAAAPAGAFYAKHRRTAAANPCHDPGTSGRACSVSVHRGMNGPPSTGPFPIVLTLHAGPPESGHQTKRHESPWSIFRRFGASRPRGGQAVPSSLRAHPCLPASAGFLFEHSLHNGTKSSWSSCGCAAAG